ncbi:MAG: M1 family metallopeptidase [Promethearchaeota archaeon]
MNALKPIHYNIHLEPDVEKFTFTGNTMIEVELLNPISEITVNVKNLEVLVCKFGKQGSLTDHDFAIEEKKEELKIALPKPIENKGTYFIYFEFKGILNDMLLGFYRSKYEVNGEERYMATTQFEEREARQAFPCFDEPALKATFDIEFVIDEKLTGIANTAIKEEKSLGNGKKLVKFDTTPRMCTYLLYFAAGEFEFIEDTTKKPTIRVATTPGKIKFGDFALDMGRKSIDYGEKFTGHPFPISKCDYIGVSDFAFGAMENYGAITFRENYLMVIPGKTPKPMISRVAQIIAHETAHMWFGDLVSPAEWKYVWLNESFASYFTYSIPDHYYPEWNAWDNFIQQTYGGMRRDALRYTVPIELPDEEAEVNIDPSSAPIIYNKGAAVIRVLNGFLGPEKFKAGIKHFLDLYKFDVANSNQYWEAFEEATGEPIQEFANSWVHQEGYPMVTVVREGNQLKLSQHRFTYLPNEETTVWLIPIKILFLKKDGTSETRDIVFKEQTMNLEIPKDTKTFKLNAEQTGFYRVNYDETVWNELGELVKSKKLSPIDRFGIASDYRALLESRKVSTTDYLDFLDKYFAMEDGYLALDEIATALKSIYTLQKTNQTQIAAVGQKIFDNALEKYGYNPKEEDSVQDAEMRNRLLWMAYYFGSKKVKEFAESKFEGLLRGEKVNAEIYGAIVQVGALSNLNSLEYFKKQLEDDSVPETMKHSILRGLGNFKDEKILKELLEYNLKTVPKRNRMFILMGVANNPLAKEWMLDYYMTNFPTFLKELPMSIVANTLVTVIPMVGRFSLEKATQFLNGIMAQKPEAIGTVKMALEIMELYASLSN